jgi:chromosome segregation ATPase
MSKEKSDTEKSHLRLKEKLQQVEKELTKTEALLEAALRERSAVDGKLGKATSDLELANKKAAIQERVLARGESKYQEREEDIRVLKLEVKRLRHEETLLVSLASYTLICYLEVSC